MTISGFHFGRTKKLVSSEIADLCEICDHFLYLYVSCFSE